MVKLFERRETPDGWLYDDKDEHSFVVHAMFHGFNLAEFDSWLEEDGWPDENLKFLRDHRARAFDSFRREDGGLLERIERKKHLLVQLEFLADCMRNAIRLERILPLARSGKIIKDANTLKGRRPKTREAKYRLSPAK